MTKRDILKTLDIASMISIFISTILVFIYQFVGEYQVIRFAIIMYTAAFLILTVFYSLKTYFVFKRTQEDGQVMFELTKSEKAWLITKVVLSALAFIFTMIILILY